MEGDLVKCFYRLGENRMTLVGIAVSAKVFPTAVERNRARRLVSWAVEKLYSQLLPALNLVIMPKKGVLKLKSEEVKQVLEKDFKKGGVIQNDQNSVPNN